MVSTFGRLRVVPLELTADPFAVRSSRAERRWQP